MKENKTWLIAVLVIYIVNYTTALRASQLIIQAKTSSTTSTTETILNDENEEIETTEVLNNTSTKPTLTGIPQIDYIWDPNLPRELHGYNLTDYPFFNALPPDDEIDFKCDGLHDGFYASVKHKCQLYHHCLFGNRYDFLCANFTAFDQKTFICHFVSEVDCKNSPKYFHRNDALYMADTTTTLAPPTTTSTTTTTTTTLAPQRRANRPRRPLRRKRPQYDDDDYFEDDYDYYEERSYRRRKQRPRHRRPDYDEEYDDRRSFSDERYDRRSYRNRNEEYEDDEASHEGRRKYEPKQKNRNRNSNTKLKDNDKIERPKTDIRKGSRFVSSNHEANLEDSVETAPPKVRTRFQEEKKRHFGNSERRHNPRDKKLTEIKKTEDHSEETSEKPEASLLVRPSVSSSSSLSSLFDRPRAAPRISRPVPLNEKNKYSYNAATTTSTTSTTKPEIDDEYYDEEDYDQDADHKSVTRDVITKQNKNPNVAEMEDDVINEEERTQPNHSVSSSKQPSTNHRDEYNQEQGEIRQNLRIVKRPFLPSRGGSPYLPRGLQPVGSLENEFSTESTPIDMGSTISGVRLLEHGQPILRKKSKDGSDTTLQPMSIQKLNIEDLYETEYDVTLNDALNPTLKPLSSDLRRRAAFPQTREHLSQTRIQESPRHPHNYYDY